jgi:hypothetical protein
LRLVAGCAPDARTRAVLVTRSGVDERTYDPVALQAFVANGGSVIGEHGNARQLITEVYGFDVPPSQVQAGACQDEPMPRIRMHAEDPLWAALGAAAPPREVETGCGYPLPDLRGLPFVPLGGWAVDKVSLGYLEFGAGRLWVVEADWQDLDRPQLTAGSLDLMAYMLAGWVPSNLPQCQNGYDDNGDGHFDVNDPGCESPADALEGDVVGRQCADGRDNDANGLVDFPFDPGCRGAGDTTEARPAAVPACANARDDDADGLVDFPADPGCAGAGDTTETQEGRTLACADGWSSDGRTPVDYPLDPDCDSYIDDEEIGGGFTPEGIIENLDPDLLDGWRVCYAATYDDATVLANVLAACDGEEVLLGCRPTGDDRLQVAAGGLRAEVFRDVGPNSQASHVHNGVQFYFDETSSIGFAPVGAPIDRNSCDYLATPDWNSGSLDATTPLRMCWHTNGNSLSAGFRCGRNVVYDRLYERVIYTR